VVTFGLVLTTSHTLIVLMTMLAPGLCRRSSASWTMATTMIALVGWLVMPVSWRLVPHPVYLMWAVSLVTFFAVAIVDRRHLECGLG